MKLGAMIGQAFHGLAIYKGKTVLMMLGPAIGVAALITVISIVQGSGRQTQKQLASFGARSINLIAGDPNPPADANVTTLTLADARAVKRNISGVERVAPALRSDMELAHRGAYTDAAVFGCTPEWLPAWNWKVARGRNLERADLAKKARVCVIGQTITRTLFGGKNPLGKTLRLGKTTFTVVGELERRGAGSPCGADMDRRVMTPLTTMMRRVRNVDHISVIRITLAQGADLQRVARQIRILMRKRHNIHPPEMDDFGVVTPKLLGALPGQVSDTLKTLLFVVGIVCLLGGGVVVMNIMLMAVSERRAEVGLRRAVGATQTDILGQFLWEAITATTAGGIVGLLLGLGAVTVIAKTAAARPTLTWLPLLAGFLVSLLVGALFGILPARRAAAMQPVEALRQ
jgi:putative ABC transport system permease protein